MRLPDALQSQEVKCGLEFIDNSIEQLIDEISRITLIPSPTHAEHELASYYAERLSQAGVADVKLDEQQNVCGWVRGVGAGPTLLMVAHLDTVFPVETELFVRRDQHRLYGPGIGDDSTGLAALLFAARALTESKLALRGNLVVAGTSCEEGLGNLKGMKSLMKTLEHQLDMVIAVEPSRIGRITNRGVGSKRFKISAITGGGHSFGAFGNASAIHALCRVVVGIDDMEVPVEPKTTYNVGKISGGVSVNTIAPKADLELDLRSVSQATLEAVEQRVHEIVKAVARSSGANMETVLIGDRPAGETGEDASLVHTVRSVHSVLGIDSFMSAGSTDANVPMWLGVPAVTVGVTTGANTHSADEYIDIAPLAAGVKQLFLLMACILG